VRIANLPREAVNRLLGAGQDVPTALREACQPMSASRRREPSLMKLFAALLKAELERLARAAGRVVDVVDNRLVAAVAKLKREHGRDAGRGR